MKANPCFNIDVKQDLITGRKKILQFSKHEEVKSGKNKQTAAAAQVCFVFIIF